MVRPNMVKSDSEPNDSEHSALSATSGSNTAKVALTRLRCRRSCIKAIVTSAIDTQLVRAATSSSTKNRVDQSHGAGRLANTSGSVTNISVAPRSSWSASPNDVTAGNMIKPISTATSSDISDTMPEVLPSLVSAG